MFRENPNPSCSRREMLRAIGGGFGALGLAGLLGDEQLRAGVEGGSGLHFPAKAKRVIFLFMNGGPSQVDTFDPKPMLKKFAGQRPDGTTLRTERKTAGLLPAVCKFIPGGQCGTQISEWLPRLGALADELCVVRSLHTDNANHAPALNMMHLGVQAPTRPSLGSWLSYGLGHENENLPGFIVLCPGKPVVGPKLWGSAFLPGEHQGTHINHSQLDPQRMIPYLRNAELDRAAQARQLALVRRLNLENLERRGRDPLLESRIRAMETAFRMQFEASDVFDVRNEPRLAQEAYGTSQFARGCLLARRLVERGVRYVQVFYGNGQPWDTHTNHAASCQRLCTDVDRPIAALLTDLKSRGLLDETLVLWGGEFGRTPVSENGNGRDHNHWGFTMWLAGGGIRGGLTYGATDDFGFQAVDDKVHVHDLHATLLHLLGIDHERLTYRYSGRDFRLTDVEGRVIRELLA